MNEFTKAIAETLGHAARFEGASMEEVQAIVFEAMETPEERESRLQDERLRRAAGLRPKTAESANDRLRRIAGLK